MIGWKVITLDQRFARGFMQKETSDFSSQDYLLVRQLCILTCSPNHI